MRRRNLRAVTCVVSACTAVLASLSTASAQITAAWTSVPISPAAMNADPALQNMQCWSLQVTTTGDWGAAGFEATLPAGQSFYNAPFGGNTKPNPALVGAFPHLAYDSYVTAPGDTGLAGRPIILGPFPPGSGGGGGERFAFTWGDLATDAPGTFEIVRLTFPTSAFPSINQISYTAQTGPTTAGPAGINLGFPQPYPLKRWLPDADGDWNSAGNWTNSELPELRERVLIDVGGATVRTITHGAGNTEVHELRSFERVAVSGGTLSSYLTEVNDVLAISGGGTFRPLGFSHLTGGGTVDVGAGGTVFIGDGNALVLGGGATLRGSGGAVAGVPGGFLINNGGRVLAPSAGDVLPIQTLSVVLQSGEVGGDGAVRVSGSVQVTGNSRKTGTGPLRVNGSFLFFGNTTALDLAGGGVVNDYAGPSPLSDIRAKIVSGYNNNTWTGPGMNSSIAAADDDLAVGYAEASALFTSFPATFMGETIDASTVLVRLVRNGDANLDSTVNLADFNRLAANFGRAGMNWSDGDFDYDGTVNLTDFNLLAANFGMSATGPGVTPEDWAALAAVVPEPGVLWLVSLPIFLRLRRRRA
jgi:hypothetical protein